MKFLGGLILFSLMLVSPVHANSLTLGDGDPFPLQCVDFSGLWRSDDGTRYQISQQSCALLRIKMIFGNFTQDTMTIVPDNKTRGMPGYERSAIRNRWNSNKNGTVIESHRTYVDGNNRISEVVMYERASAGLLLETTYTTIECLDKPGKVERDYEQQVFRRVNRSDEYVFVKGKRVKRNH